MRKDCYWVDFLHRQLFGCGIFPQLILDMRLYCFRILTHRVHIVAAAPEFPIPILVYLRFHFVCDKLWASFNVLLLIV